MDKDKSEQDEDAWRVTEIGNTKERGSLLIPLLYSHSKQYLLLTKF